MIWNYTNSLKNSFRLTGTWNHKHIIPVKSLKNTVKFCFAGKLEYFDVYETRGSPMGTVFGINRQGMVIPIWLVFLTFMGPCIAKVFSSITKKMQRYTIYLFLRNALHVSGGSSAHHQELKNCIYSIGYFVKPLLLPATVVAGSSKGLTKYPMLYPDDGRRNRLKHVEHFTKINKLCNVASCWLNLKKN